MRSLLSDQRIRELAKGPASVLTFRELLSAVLKAAFEVPKMKTLFRVKPVYRENRVPYSVSMVSQTPERCQLETNRPWMVIKNGSDIYTEVNVNHIVSIHEIYQWPIEEVDQDILNHFSIPPIVSWLELSNGKHIVIEGPAEMARGGF
jgi:hypothetical protein